MEDVREELYLGKQELHLFTNTSGPTEACANMLQTQTRRLGHLHPLLLPQGSLRACFVWSQKRKSTSSGILN